MSGLDNDQDIGWDIGRDTGRDLPPDAELDVGAWLQSLGLSRYAEEFAENDIDRDVLLLLDDADLEKLGVRSLGHRKKVLAAIAALKSRVTDRAQTSDPAPAVVGRGATAAEPIGERRAVTVMFCDIAGFTDLATRCDPEELHTILEEYFEAVDGVIERYGGHVDKHIGDAVMGLFGAPVAHTNDPERAVRAACEIRRAVYTLDHPLRVHIGIASGSVVASGTGSTAHREYTVTGSTVNLAARLQDLADSDQIVVSESVHREVHALVDGKALDRVSLKGIATPVQAWCIERLCPKSAPIQRTPFVGRRDQIERFIAHLSALRERGRGHLIHVRGEAGIGKSRLVSEFCDRAAEWEVAIHSAMVLDFGDGDDQSTMSDLVGSMLGVARAQSADQRFAAAEHALDTGVVAAHRDVFLYDLLDIAKPNHLRARYDAMSTRARRDGKSETLQDCVTALTRERPLLLVIEDLHWAGAELIEHIAHLGRQLDALPVLMVVTSRIQGSALQAFVDGGDDGDRDGFRRAVRHGSMELGPLPVDEAFDLARASLANDSALMLDSYVERAGGNPLFLEQLLRNAEERASDALPDSIQGIVLARIDRLDPGDKRALQAASVLGQRFSLTALQALTGDLEFSVTELVEHQLIQPAHERVSDGEYLFIHALVREGVYSSLLREHRKDWHIRAAGFFVERNPVLHAEHLDRAGHPDRIQAYLDAAHELSREYRHEHALELCRRGLELTGAHEEGASLAHAFTCLSGDLLLSLGAITEALDCFLRGEELACSDDERLQTWLGSARCLRVVESIDDALATLDRAQPVAEARGHAETLAKIHHLRGNLLFPRGDFVECHRQHSMARDHARAAASATLEAQAMSGLADAALMQGRFSVANRYVERCLTLCDEHELTAVDAANRAIRGYARMFEGQLDGALDDGMVAADLARLIGDRRAEIIARGEVASVVLIEMGRLDEADAQLGIALAGARELGITRVESSLTRFLGVVRAESGRPREGLALIEAALELSRAGEFAYMGPSILGALARYTDDPDTRQGALTEGEQALDRGTAGYNHIFFYRDAIEACFLAGDAGGVRRYAAALEAYCQGEPPGWGQFLVTRGRLLARHLSDGLDDQRAESLAGARARVLQQARDAHLHLAASTLRRLM